MDIIELGSACLKEHCTCSWMVMFRISTEWKLFFEYNWWKHKDQTRTTWCQSVKTLPLRWCPLTMIRRWFHTWRHYRLEHARLCCWNPEGYAIYTICPTRCLTSETFCMTHGICCCFFLLMPWIPFGRFKSRSCDQCLKRSWEIMNDTTHILNMI